MIDPSYIKTLGITIKYNLFFKVLKCKLDSRVDQQNIINKMQD
jgi:hypothetical protein